MGRRSTSLSNYTNTAISREIASEYDNVEIVADNIADVKAVADLLTAEVLENIAELATLTADVNTLQTEMDAAELAIAGKALTVHTHTSEQVVDSVDKRFVTDTEKDKWNAIGTNEELRDRATHTGVQSLDTTTDSATRVAMTPEERTKLDGVATGATANATDAQLRDRTTHTGTQSISTITETATGKIMTDTERSKLANIELEANNYIHPAKHNVNVLDGTGHELEYVRVDESGVTTFDNIRWGDLVGKPTTFSPSAHVHSMDDVTSGTLSATRVDTTTSRRFVTDAELAVIANAETKDAKGAANGYAPLDATGKINPSYLGSLNLLDVFTPTNVVSMLQLTSANPGDVAYVQDTETTYMLVALPVDTLSNWKQINATASVISINGLTGTVSMSTTDIPEGDNLYHTSERVDDRVKDLLVAGTNVSLVYDDVANTLTVNANDTSVNWSELQSVPNTVAGYGISDVYTETEVNAVVATIDNTLADHANAIVDNTASIIALAKSNATGSFGATGLALNINGTQQTLPFTVKQQSTNTDKFELGTDEITIKATGNYTFLSTVTFEDAGANGAVGTVTFRVRDAGVTYHTQTTTVEIIGNDRDTVPFNSLLVVPSGVPITAYITVSCNITGYRIVGFESVLASEKAVGELSGLASHTAVTPVGDIAATNVQAALEELDSEKEPANSNIQSHISSTSNPHSVTKTQVGLGNVDNTSDTDKPVSTATATAISNSAATKLDLTVANASHIGRGDKYLAAQSIANMIYTSGNLTKIRYNNDTDVDYETLTYTNGDLTSIGHYVAGALVGTTTLTYTAGSLVSAIYA